MSPRPESRQKAPTESLPVLLGRGSWRGGGQGLQLCSAALDCLLKPFPSEYWEGSGGVEGGFILTV